MSGRDPPTLGGSLCGEESALPLAPSCWAQAWKKASWTRGGFHAEPWGAAAAGVEGSSRTPGRMGAAPATIHRRAPGRRLRESTAARRRRYIPKTKTVNKPKRKLPPPAPIPKDLLAHELVDVEVEARRRKQAHLAELRREAPVQLLDPA